MTELMTDTKPSRFVITCQEVGCDNHIFYTKEDSSVPLYCWKHRSREGRHAAVRLLKNPEPAKPEAPKFKVQFVILKCINKKCQHRDEVPESEWCKKPTGYTCGLCGSKMLYHKDMEEGK